MLQRLSAAITRERAPLRQYDVRSAGVAASVRDQLGHGKGPASGEWLRPALQARLPYLSFFNRMKSPRASIRTSTSSPVKRPGMKISKGSLS